MLENMRRQGASIFVYLIFCLLIAIFVINFGPQRGNGANGGCRGSSNLVVSVNGEDATQTAYRIAYSANQASGKQKTWIAIELLIRRSILAQEAESRGLLSTNDSIQDEIKKGWFFMGGQRMKIPGIFDEDGLWNINAFKRWVGELNVSKNAYLGEQERSMLAWMMANVIQDSVVVSREEALSEFLFQGNTAMYDVVAFKPEVYRSALKLTDADVDRFVASHGDEIQARYKADERTYKGVKPQLLLRQIFIEKSAAGSGSAAAPDAGKAKLEAARTAIGTSKEKFAASAKELNSDEGARNAAGDLGWRTIDNPMLGDKALSDAVKALKPGEMTPVITTDRGAFLIMAEDKREGDLTFDQVKHEIAKELARDTWGKEAAKRAALLALSSAQTGAVHNLDALYEKDKTEGPGPGGIDLEKIINNPNLTDEQKQQLLQQLIQQQQGGAGPAPAPDEGNDGPHGSITIESKDIPAGWSADANGAGGSGSAAAGSGAGSAAAPAAPPPATLAEVNTPSKDQLPALADVPKPHVTRFGPAPRSSEMPGLGKSKEAIAAVFDELEQGALATKIYEGDHGDFIVVQEIQRQKPNVADFDKDADDRVAALREQRSRAFLNEWLKERCEKLVKDGKIITNNELLVERDDQGRVLQSQYRPCISFR